MKKKKKKGKVWRDRKEKNMSEQRISEKTKI